MVTGKRRAPVCQDADEPTRLNVSLHLILGQVCESEPGRAAFNRSVMLLKYSCPWTCAFISRPGFLELPGIQAAVGRKSQVDAVVVGQVLRLLRRLGRRAK